jgi:spore coat protein U-like protein
MTGDHLVLAKGRSVIRHRVFPGATALFFFALLSQTFPVAAACRFKSISDISFGAYDVFSALPNTSGVGSLSISCSGDGEHEHSNFDVTLSTGQSNSYAYRIMKNGPNSLNYNLYTNAARTVVWGNGTGSSSVMSASRNGTTLLSVFGLIPDGQDVAFGTYTDSITATVNF